MENGHPPTHMNAVMTSMELAHNAECNRIPATVHTHFSAFRNATWLHTHMASDGVAL